MEWCDTGLVLARGVFRENDVWLRLLCRDHGLETVFAFGGQRSRRRFAGCLDLLNILDVRVRTGSRGYADLCEAALVRGPGPLRSSPALLGTAANCVRLVEIAAVMPENAPAFFRLLEETLSLLGEQGDGGGLLMPFFRLRVMTILGCGPEFRQCTRCRAPVDAAFFSVREGGVLCSACRGLLPPGPGAPLSAESLRALDRAARLWPSAWPELSLAPADRRGAARCLDEMLAFHAGITWRNGRFHRT